jgi:hypothetical protein
VLTLRCFLGTGWKSTTIGRRRDAGLHHAASVLSRRRAKPSRDDEPQWDSCQIVEDVFRRGAYLSSDFIRFKAEADGPTGKYVAGVSHLTTLVQRDAALGNLIELLLREGWEDVRHSGEGTRRQFQRPSRLRSSTRAT